MLSPDLIYLIRNNAKRFNVDPYIVAAICMVESSGEGFSCRFEPNWKYFTMVEEMAARNGITEATEKILQQISMGPGQVMGSVARELGYVGPLGALMTNNIGIEYCARLVRRLADKYSNRDDLFASYNAGSPRRTDDDKEYANQSYVDKANYWLNQYSTNPLLK